MKESSFCAKPRRCAPAENLTVFGDCVLGTGSRFFTTRISHLLTQDGRVTRCVTSPLSAALDDSALHSFFRIEEREARRCVLCSPLPGEGGSKANARAARSRGMAFRDRERRCRQPRHDDGRYFGSTVLGVQVHWIAPAVVDGDNTRVSAPPVVMAVLALLPKVTVTSPPLTFT